MDRQHRTGVAGHGAGFFHAQGPLVDDAATVSERKRAGHAQGGKLTQAVSGQRRRAHSVRQQQPRQRDFQGEHRRLLPAGVPQFGVRRFKQQPLDIKAKMTARFGQQVVYRRKGLAQFPAHADILRTLARKHQGHCRSCRCALAGDVNALSGQRPAPFFRQRRQIFQHPAVRQLLLRRLRGIGKYRNSPDLPVNRPRQVVQTGRPVRHDASRRIFGLWRRRFPVAGLFQLNHKVGTAEAESVDLKPARPASRRLPGRRLRENDQAGPLQLQCRIRFFTIQCCRIQTGIHRHDAPDQAADAGCAERMADLGFETGNDRPLAGRIQGLQCRDLFEIALTGRSGVAFHQVHRFRPVGQAGERGLNGADLAVPGGFHHAGFGVAGAHAGNIAVNMRAPAPGHGFALDHDHAGPFAHHKAVPAAVKRPGHRRSRPIRISQPGQSAQHGKLEEVQR